MSQAAMSGFTSVGKPYSAAPLAYKIEVPMASGETGERFVVAGEAPYIVPLTMAVEATEFLCLEQLREKLHKHWDMMLTDFWELNGRREGESHDDMWARWRQSDIMRRVDGEPKCKTAD